MRWLNLEIQILTEDDKILIRLDLINIRLNLFRLVSGSPRVGVGPPSKFFSLFRLFRFSLGTFNQSVFGLISTSVRFSFDLWFFINPASFTGFGFLSAAFLLHISWTSTSVEFDISKFLLRAFPPSCFKCGQLY